VLTLKKVLDPEHELILTSMSNFALALMFQSKYEMAKETPAGAEAKGVKL
jgi:hypothetical protein